MNPRIMMLGIFLVGISMASLLPAEYAPPTFDIWDKLLHAGIYFMLTIVAAWASGYRWHLVMPLIIFGSLIEAAQGLIPGRYPDVADAMANGVGILAGVVAFHIPAVWRRPAK